MQVKSINHRHLLLEVFIMLAIPVFSVEGNGHRDDDGTLSLAPLSVTVAVLPWPPHANNANSTDGWQVKVIDKLNTTFKAWKNIFNVKFVKTQNQKELNKLFKMNKTDIGFPVIKQNGEDVQNFYHLGYRPRLDYLVAPNIQSPSEVCIKTLLDSWPLLALSLIFSGIAGVVIWLLEVLSNREEFPSSFARGSWEGFWWAFISMTTVGYGDKCPRSIAGRIFAVLWIFAGVVLVAVFIANVTTALTSVSVKPEYKLSSAKQVGVVKHSLEEIIAKEEGSEIVAFENHNELMTAFAKKRVSGIVIDNYTAWPYFENLTDSFFSQIQRINLKSKHHVVAASSGNYEKRISKYKDNISPLHEENLLNYIISFGNATENTWLKIVSAKYKRLSDDNYKMDPLCFILGEVMANFWSNEMPNQDFEGAEDGSSMEPQSFNLFIDSKEFLETATYLLLGVLAGLIVIGLIVDKIFWNVKSHRNGDLDVKVHKGGDTMQEIAKGKELLNQLHLFLQKMERKIDKMSKCEDKNTGRVDFAND